MKLDLFSEALDLDIFNSLTSDNHTGSEKGFEKSFSSDRSICRQNLRKGGVISQAIQKVR